MGGRLSHVLRPMMTAFCLPGSAVRLVSSLKYRRSPGMLQGRVPPARGTGMNSGSEVVGRQQRRRFSGAKPHSLSHAPLPMPHCLVAATTIWKLRRACSAAMVVRLADSV